MLEVQLNHFQRILSETPVDHTNSTNTKCKRDRL